MNKYRHICPLVRHTVKLQPWPPSSLIFLPHSTLAFQSTQGKPCNIYGDGRQPPLTTQAHPDTINTSSRRPVENTKGREGTSVLWCDVKDCPYQGLKLSSRLKKNLGYTSKAFLDNINAASFFFEQGCVHFFCNLIQGHVMNWKPQVEV